MNADIAWAAGLFEGEGYLVRRHTGNRVYLQLGLQTTDLDVLERFVEIMQSNGVIPSTRVNGKMGKPAGIIRRKQRKAHHKQSYSWSATGKHAATGFRLLRPWLGQRRRAAGDSVIAEAEHARSQALAERRCEECGEPFKPNDYGHVRRFCSNRCVQKARGRRPDYRAKANERQRRYKQRQRLGQHAGQQSLLRDIR